jgi:hypothetical protein
MELTLEPWVLSLELRRFALKPWRLTLELWRRLSIDQKSSSSTREGST